MSVMDKEGVVTTAREREHECQVEVQAFKKRLGLLSWTNWITIVMPMLLSTFAGASILAHPSLAAEPSGIDWKLWTGLASLLSALLVGIHKGRNCDPYQAECRRLVQAYGGLAAKYRTLHQFDNKSATTKLLELDASLATIRETAGADVPEGYRDAARRRIVELSAA